MRHLPGTLPPQTVARWHAVLDRLPGASLKLATALPPDEVLQALAPLRPRLLRGLGAGAQLLLSQCWVRRARPPHSWHQDGALHFDFTSLQGEPPADALLPMLTCWMPLDDCGVDAPGLEWLQPSPPHLLVPAELTDEALQARFPASAFQQPPLAAGDALVFDGALVHRTHVRPTMTRPRTSIELRFVAGGGVPPRLAQETLRPIR
jgi:ectoine hydroxylase-related dioxygenase (phytanoyl-CoA dioxygenase family)